ncbi:hypothetical protein OGATHE_001582 [Ogataea polymorpha]|uniref:Transcription initiation factor TFIID subunit 13 n=1 Tax=Ogataea polymorpha TaxID=460523 RepID=A0A9P8PNA3_9ASCO|nr:hypothetical protein OGATHE_001582 [Ogataea polymorpha]
MLADVGTTPTGNFGATSAGIWPGRGSSATLAYQPPWIGGMRLTQSWSMRPIWNRLNVAIVSSQWYAFISSVASRPTMWWTALSPPGWILIQLLRRRTHLSNRQRLFSNDLKALLYAFGDSPAPNHETIQTLEDVLTTYMIDLIVAANHSRLAHGRNRLKIDDVKFVLRKDPTKLARIHDLQKMDREISKAKKLFDEKAQKKE